MAGLAAVPFHGTRLPHRRPRLPPHAPKPRCSAGSEHPAATPEPSVLWVRPPCGPRELELPGWEASLRLTAVGAAPRRGDDGPAALPPPA